MSRELTPPGGKGADAEESGGQREPDAEGRGDGMAGSARPRRVGFRRGAPPPPETPQNPQTI